MLYSTHCCQCPASGLLCVREQCLELRYYHQGRAEQTTQRNLARESPFGEGTCFDSSWVVRSLGHYGERRSVCVLLLNGEVAARRLVEQRPACKAIFLKSNSKTNYPKSPSSVRTH